MAFKYKAFISYSHADKKWGDWLHKALETYRVPKALVAQPNRDGGVPKKLFPIFRDREELPTSDDLGGMLKTALEDAAYLIVICSPRSAASLWVNEEILAFKRMGKENRILALVVDGEPNAADQGRADRECFPKALKFQIGEDGELTKERTEPIAADARPGKDGRENAKLKLLAGLLGVKYDALRQREKRRRRQQRLGLAAAAAVVMGIIGAVWYQGELQRREEQAARIAQERETRYAAALPFAEEAHRMADQNRPLEALRAAARALPPGLDEDNWPIIRAAETALYRALLDFYPSEVVPHGIDTRLQDISFSEDRSRVLLLGVDGHLVVFSTSPVARIFDADLSRSFEGLNVTNYQAWLSPGGEDIIGVVSGFTSVTGRAPNQSFRWPVSAGATALDGRPMENSPLFIGMSQDRALGVGMRLGESPVELWDLDKMELIGFFETDWGRQPDRVGISPDGRHIFAIRSEAEIADAALVIFDVPGGQRIFEKTGAFYIETRGPTDFSRSLKFLAFTPSGHEAAFLYGDESGQAYISIIDLDEGAEKYPPIYITSDGSNDREITLLEGGERVLVRGLDGPGIVNIERGEVEPHDPRFGRLAGPMATWQGPDGEEYFAIKELLGEALALVKFNSDLNPVWIRSVFGTIESLAVSAGRDRLMAVTSKAVQTWQMPTWRSRPLVDDRQAGVKQVAISGDGKIIAAARIGGQIDIFDGETKSLLQQLSPPADTGLAWFTLNEDGSRLVAYWVKEDVVTSDDIRWGDQQQLTRYPGITRLIDLGAGEIMGEWQSTRGPMAAPSADRIWLFPEGRAMTSYIWSTGELRHIFPVRSDDITSIISAFDGALFAVVHQNNDISILHGDGRDEVLARFNGYNGQIPPDERTGYLADLLSPEPPSRLKFHESIGALFYQYGSFANSFMIPLGVLLEEGEGAAVAVALPGGYADASLLISDANFSLLSPRDSFSAGQAELFDPEHQLIQSFSDSDYYSYWERAAFSAGSQYLMVPTGMGYVYYPLDDPAEAHFLTCPERPNLLFPRIYNGGTGQLILTADGRYFIGASGAALCVWDRKSDTLFARFGDHSSPIHSFIERPGTREIISLDERGLVLVSDYPDDLHDFARQIMPLLDAWFPDRYDEATKPAEDGK